MRPGEMTRIQVNLRRAGALAIMPSGCTYAIPRSWLWEHACNTMVASDLRNAYALVVLGPNTGRKIGAGMLREKGTNTQ